MSIKRKLEYLAKTKQEIRKAIISRGVDVDRDDTFRSYAGKIRDIRLYDEYDGPYILTPSTEIQTFNTFDKRMTDNLTVNAMPVYDGSFMPVLTSFAMVEPPTKSFYTDGESIDLTGAVFQAYYSAGRPWEGDSGHPNGTIPVSELTVSPTKADISERSEKFYGSKDRKVIAKIVKCTEPGSSYGTYITYYYGGDLGNNAEAGITGMCSGEDNGVAFFITRYDNGSGDALYLGTEESTSKWFTFGGYINGWKMRHGSFSSESAPSKVFTQVNPTNNYIYMGKYDFSNVPESVADPSEYAETDLEYIGGTQTITVFWDRAGDGQQLATDIEVRVDE